MLTLGAVVLELILAGVVPGCGEPDVGGVDGSGMVNGAVFGVELGEKAKCRHAA